MEKPILLYALCGSQRLASTNRLLLEALSEHAPEGISIEICDLIGDLPIFNPDREGESTPAIVEEFATKVRAADGVIVACPEYAHGIPGSFKNALDWLVSRDEVPFKPLMLAHTSHRGEFVLSQLQEVLTTMSFAIIPQAFLRVPVLGKTPDAQREALMAAAKDGTLAVALNTFRAAIERTAS